jgi:hypothetical protein
MTRLGLRQFLIGLALTLALAKTAGAQQGANAEKDNPCSSNDFPAELRNKLKSEYAAWKIQNLQDLSPSANARWAGGSFTGCPGIAVGEFRETSGTSYAVLLVPQEKPDSGYQLISYTPKSSSSEAEFRIVEKRSLPGASNFFLRTGKMSELFDEESRRKFQIKAKEAFLLFDVGEQEYEVDAYFWSNGAYRNSPVDL